MTKGFKRQTKDLCGQKTEALRISGCGPSAIERLTLERVNTCRKTWEAKPKVYRTIRDPCEDRPGSIQTSTTAGTQ